VRSQCANDNIINEKYAYMHVITKINPNKGAFGMERRGQICEA
jgi:hypothetical protein